MSDVKVTIIPGTSFRAEAGDTLLRSALRAGLGFPYECNCGGCLFELVEGDLVDRWPDAPGLSPSARAHRRLLACQSEVHQALAGRLDSNTDSKSFEYYMCGPPPMIDALQKLLVIGKSVPMVQLHFDRFA